MVSREDILRMAREAGLEEAFCELFYASADGLARFAGLVAQQQALAERQACAALIRGTKEWKAKGWVSTLSPETAEAIALAIEGRDRA